MLLVGNQKEYIILSPQHSLFLHEIKFSGYKIEIKFDKKPLVVEQDNYVTKNVNAYIVYNLDD